MADTGALVEVPSAASAENLLVDRLRAIRGDRARSYAVHVHLSELQPHNRKSNYFRIAARTFEFLVSRHDATLFVLFNSDLALLCRDAPVDDIDQAVSRVRSLFIEDPLTAGPEGSPDDRFATWYDLSRGDDYAAFLGLARDLAAAAAHRSPWPADGPPAGMPGAMPGAPLGPTALSAIGEKLRETSITDLIRRQSAIEVHAGGRGEVVFQEHYVSMAALQKRLAPGINLFGNMWLFQYLTEALDRRMLGVLADTDFAGRDGAISVNLNISTVLSEDFRNLRRTLGGHASRIVVEMHVIDIFADMGAFAYARDTLRADGCRVLIDGLTPLLLQYFDPASLAPDFLKIGWSPDIVVDPPEDLATELRDLVEHAGRDAVILSRVDGEDAVRWGLGIGINRFQGHFIDKLVDAMSAKGII